MGSISIPELPGYWPGRDGPRDEFCPLCHRRTHEGKSCAEHEEYCKSPGHDQVGCECDSPFNCV